VREWLHSLADEDCRAIGQDLMTVQFGWPVGMPLCRNLGHGLWEVRTNLENRIARVIFCFAGGELVALHGDRERNSILAAVTSPCCNR
ncbi:MAG: type II toxin-antitoxin system RelE/ParE family toxin, partial [Pseudomonadota bacterium]